MTKEHLSEVFTPDDLQDSAGQHEKAEQVIAAGGTPVPTRQDKDVRERPLMYRASTNRTQIFHPDDDGLELDGLPLDQARIFGLELVEEGRRCFYDRRICSARAFV